MLAAEASPRRGLYRRVERTWLAIHSTVARDLASVAERDMPERLVSVRSPSGTSLSSLCKAGRLAAAFANQSAFSLPATLLWAGAQRMVTSPSRTRIRSQTFIAATAKHWHEPRASFLTRSMAVESTETVHRWPLPWRRSKTRGAWYMANVSASNTSLFVPR